MPHDNGAESEDESLPSSAGGSDSGGDTVADDPEPASDSTPRRPDPAATRHSSRAEALKSVDYSAKHHPQDSRLPFYQRRAQRSRRQSTHVSPQPQPSRRSKKRSGSTQADRSGEIGSTSPEPSSRPSKKLRVLSDRREPKKTAGGKDKSKDSKAKSKIVEAVLVNSSTDVDDIVELAIMGSQVSGKARGPSGVIEEHTAQVSARREDHGTQPDDQQDEAIDDPCHDLDMISASLDDVVPGSEAGDLEDPLPGHHHSDNNSAAGDRAAPDEAAQRQEQQRTTDHSLPGSSHGEDGVCTDAVATHHEGSSECAAIHSSNLKPVQLSSSSTLAASKGNAGSRTASTSSTLVAAMDHIQAQADVFHPPSEFEEQLAITDNLTERLEEGRDQISEAEIQDSDGCDQRSEAGYGMPRLEDVESDGLPSTNGPGPLYESADASMANGQTDKTPTATRPDSREAKTTSLQSNTHGYPSPLQSFDGTSSSRTPKKLSTQCHHPVASNRTADGQGAAEHLGSTQLDGAAEESHLQEHLGDGSDEDADWVTSSLDAPDDPGEPDQSGKSVTKEATADDSQESLSTESGVAANSLLLTAGTSSDRSD